MDKMALSSRRDVNWRTSCVCLFFIVWDCSSDGHRKVPVWAVLDYTETNVISRELLLAKVSILGPEYLEEQFVGGPSHEPRRAVLDHDESSKMERETALAHNFERSAHPNQFSESFTSPITPSQALRLKHQHLHSISVLAKQFGAKIVDVSENSVIVELTAKTTRVEAFLNLLKPFGILEAARTGTSHFQLCVLRDSDSAF